MYKKQADFRFYEELNDFLPIGKRKKKFTYLFNGIQTVKDAIEAIGVPHVEVDLILVNGESINFKYRIKQDDQISVYPVFELLNINNLTHLRKKPLRNTKFVLDVHLGKLARFLRLLGFDTLYQNNYSDPQIIEISVSNKRIILTRDLGILKNEKVTRGYWLRSQDSKQQLYEVLKKFDLYSKIDIFSRCMACNGTIKRIKKENVLSLLEPKTLIFYTKFFQCCSCRKVYWEGSHYKKLKKFAESIKEE